MRELTASGAEMGGEAPFNTVLIKNCDRDLWNFLYHLKDSSDTDKKLPHNDDVEFEVVDPNCLGSHQVEARGSHSIIERFSNGQDRTEGMFVRVEVTKKCPSSLADCLREFDLVLSRVGAECVGVTPILTAIGGGVRGDLSRKQVRVVDDLMKHRYNLLTLKRLERYSEELGFEVPSDTVEGLWEAVYAGETDEGKRELLSSAGLGVGEVPVKYH